MLTQKANIITQLRNEILSLQGFPKGLNNKVDVDLGVINNAFPNTAFPLGAVHEFLCTGAENAAATNGFIAALLASLMKQGGISLWISSARTVLPSALKSFGIAPDKIIFIDLEKEKQVKWVMEEALKYEGLAAVVGEIKELNFTDSRRFQLAVEKSRVTGCIIRRDLRSINITASVSRWEITCLSSLSPDMPGVGFPCWNVELLKIRNGKPGSWQLEWIGNRFRHISPLISLPQERQRKTG